MPGIEPFVGEIGLFAMDYAPDGWLLCNGQTVSIADYEVLYAVVGTTFGGTGVTTFALPNLNGRVAVGAGSGPGLSSYQPGQTGGVETVTLTSGQMPPHSHATSAAGSATSKSPVDALPASGNVALHNDAPTTEVSVTPAAGANQPHDNMQPSLALHYWIAAWGLYPTRS